MTDIEDAIMGYLNANDTSPTLRGLLPEVINRTGASEDVIKSEIMRLNREHRFSISLDDDLEIHFYLPWMLRCHKCHREWDATNYDTFGGGIYYTGFRMNKEALCRDCEMDIINDWYARHKPELSSVWDDSEVKE